MANKIKRFSFITILGLIIALAIPRLIELGRTESDPVPLQYAVALDRSSSSGKKLFSSFYKQISLMSKRLNQKVDLKIFWDQEELEKSITAGTVDIAMVPYLRFQSIKESVVPVAQSANALVGKVIIAREFSTLKRLKGKKVSIAIKVPKKTGRACELSFLSVSTLAKYGITVKSVKITTGNKKLGKRAIIWKWGSPADIKYFKSKHMAQAWKTNQAIPSSILVVSMKSKKINSELIKRIRTVLFDSPTIFTVPIIKARKKKQGDCWKLFKGPGARAVVDWQQVKGVERPNVFDSATLSLLAIKATKTQLP